MKDNTREAVFNLIGGWIPGKLAIDLFAGTGAIGLEAVSRGALRAILVEHHFATARLIEQNVRDLDASSQASVVMSDTFYWARQFLKQTHDPKPAWSVFCSPPYDLYTERTADVRQLIHSLWNAAPADSIFVVEADSRFDASDLPQAAGWRVHEYSPAIIYVWRPTADPQA